MTTGALLVDAFGEDARDARVSLSARLDGVDTTEIFRLRDNGFELVLPPGTVAAQDVLNARYGGTHAVEISARDRDAFLGEYKMSVFAALDAVEDEGIASTIRATIYTASGFEGQLWTYLPPGLELLEIPSDAPGLYRDPIPKIPLGDDYILSDTGIGIRLETARPYSLPLALPDEDGSATVLLTTAILDARDGPDDVRESEIALEIRYAPPQLYFTSDSYPHLTAGDASVGEVLARFRTPSVVAEWLPGAQACFTRRR